MILDKWKDMNMVGYLKRSPYDWFARFRKYHPSSGHKTYKTNTRTQ